MNKLVERAYRKLKVVDMSLHMIVLESMLAPHEITNVTGSAISCGLGRYKMSVLHCFNKNHYLIFCFFKVGE